MNKKTILIIGAVLVLLLIGVLLAYYYSFVVPKKAIAERCENYVPNWENFIDCYGVISVTDAWDVDYLSLKDHVHKYEIARVYNSEQYSYSEGKIYVTNKNTIEGQTSNGQRTYYYQKLYRNNKISTEYYNSISDIPTHLVINTKTGEVKVYKSLTEASETEKQYFAELK